MSNSLCRLILCPSIQSFGNRVLSHADHTYIHTINILLFEDKYTYKLKKRELKFAFLFFEK